MSRRSKMSFKLPPLTYEKEKPMPNFITCHVCGNRGGTLVKTDDDTYKHDYC